MRKWILYPYVCTVIGFVIIYMITLIIPNDILYLGLANEWPEVKLNNKVPLQAAIFTWGLIFVLTLINIFQILTLKSDEFSRRFYLSLLTVILINLINWGVCLIIDYQVWNLYKSPSLFPAYLTGLITFLIVDVVLLSLDLIKFIVFKLIDRNRIRSYIPQWMVEN